MAALPTVSFDVAHHEIFNLSTGLKVLRRKLSANFKLTMNKDPITLERLRDAAIFVITGPREKFTTQEFDAMTEYLKEGGSILVTLGEGGEAGAPERNRTVRPVAGTEDEEGHREEIAGSLVDRGVGVAQGHGHRAAEHAEAHLEHHVARRTHDPEDGT